MYTNSLQQHYLINLETPPTILSHCLKAPVYSACKQPYPCVRNTQRCLQMTHNKNHASCVDRLLLHNKRSASNLVIHFTLFHHFLKSKNWEWKLYKSFKEETNGPSSWRLTINLSFSQPFVEIQKSKQAFRGNWSCKCE